MPSNVAESPTIENPIFSHADDIGCYSIQVPL